MKRRVVITGIGCVTPLGNDVETMWRRLLAGESQVDRTELFDASTFPTTFSSQVRGFDLAKVLGDKYETHRHVSRNTGFALGACLEAWRDAGLDRVTFDRSMAGLYLGSGDGPVDFWPFVHAAIAAWDKDKKHIDAKRWADVAYKEMDIYREVEQDPNMSGSHVAKLLDLRGPNMNCLTACAASTQALGEAMKIVEHGDADVMVAGGTHSMIHVFGVTGFNRLTALSQRNDDPKGASRPFTRTRDGFILGEGAGTLIIESEEFARKRGARIYGELAGYGSSADAFRITDIHSEGRGGIAAMTAAMADAGVKPQDVDYISAHGTSTTENDKIETLAVKKTFGEFAKSTPMSSAKSVLGHLIAAAGAVEAITCVLAIRDQILPPTYNYGEPDPDLDLDYIPNAPRKADVKVCLSNSFGFGGQNDTVIIRAYNA